MSGAKILVAASVAMYAGFGVLGLARPERVAELIHILPRDATAIGEIRAMYGGVQLGIAAFLMSCLLRRGATHSGLFLVAALFTGAAGARTKAFVSGEMPDLAFVAVWIFEIVWALACIVTLAREKS